MKKSFIYVLMAAAALTTTTLAACSDDDDDIATDYEDNVTDVTAYIMSHILTVDENGNLASVEEFCEDYDKDTKTVIYHIDKGSTETVDSIFYALVPDSLEKHVTGTSPNLSLSYQQDGKTYSLTMRDGGSDCLAVITLPEAEGYKNYATTLEITDRNDDNDVSLTDYFRVGKRYYIAGVNILTSDADGVYRLYPTHFNTSNEINAARSAVGYYTSPMFYCFAITEDVAYFLYVPRSYALAQDGDYLGKSQAPYYVPNSLTTNDAYTQHSFMPAKSCVARVHNWAMMVAKVHNTTAMNVLDDIFNCGTDNAAFATCETKNPLVGYKTVTCVDFDQHSYTEVRKNSHNIVNVMFVHRAYKRDIVAQLDAQAQNNDLDASNLIDEPVSDNSLSEKKTSGLQGFLCIDE